MSDHRELYETILCARVASKTAPDAGGPRRATDRLLEQLDRYAAERGTPRALAYAAAVRAAYDRYGARRTFLVFAPRVWRLLVEGNQLRAAEEWRWIWEPTMEALDGYARDNPAPPPAREAPAPRPGLAVTAPATPSASLADPAEDLDTPWWDGWGDTELEAWLEEVGDAHCDIRWSAELGRPHVVPRLAYVPPWVLSDAYQLRDVLTEYFTRSRKAAAA